MQAQFIIEYFACANTLSQSNITQGFGRGPIQTVPQPSRRYELLQSLRVLHGAAEQTFNVANLPEVA